MNVLAPLFAQTAAPAAGGFGSLAPCLFQIGAIFAIFYFLMIRPQQSRAKAHKAMLDAVKRGDEVVTGGGLIGRVTKVADTEIEVEVAPGMRLRTVRGTLSDVRTKPLPAAANDAKN